jgi:hypothetical protein
VESRLQSTPGADARVQVQVNLANNVVTVDDAHLASRPGSGTAVTTDVPSSRQTGLDVPRVNPATVQTRPLRAPASNDLKADNKAPAVPNTIQGPAGEAPRQNAPAPAAAVGAVPPAAAEAPRVAAVFPGLPAAAAALVGAPAASVAAPAPREAGAVITRSDAAPLTVVSRGTVGNAQRVAVVAPAAALPEGIKSQIRQDLGAAAVPTGDRPVEVVMDIRADKSVRAVEVKNAPVTSEAPPAVAPAPPAAPLSAPAAPVTAAPAVPPAAPNAPMAPAAPAAPVAPGASSAEPATVAADVFPVVQSAKTLATTLGIQATSVQLQAPSEPPPAASLSVPTQSRRTIELTATRADTDGKPTAVRAEGRFGDFSPATQAQIREILGRFNAAPLVDENSQVVFEARPAAKDRFDVVSIAVKDPENPGKQTVMIWREADVAAAPPPADEAHPSQPTDRTSQETITQPTRQAPARAVPPRSSGLAPAVSAIATKAYGMPESGFELRKDPKGGIKIDPVANTKPDVLVEPRAIVADSREFGTVGRDVDFTDTIREQVDAQLRAAVENGETWATEALKGTRQVQVTFIVDETAPEGPVVRVKDVTPTMQDAARDAAQAMGLRPGDFFIVNLGEQSLIVLERHVAVQVPLGDSKFKLVSPDGDAKVFVNPNKTRKDPTEVLMLSRESLKANRAALAKAGGPQGEAAIRAALDGNAKAEEFIVRIDPNADDRILIKAMQAGVADPSLTGVKKPEEKP